MKRFHLFQILLLSIFLLFNSNIQAKKVVKILAIGNSFSVDAVEQNLYELARTAGDSLVIGNAYIGGCSIDRHWNNAQTGKTEYSYRKIVGGIKTEKNNMNLTDIVEDDNWDIITVQQASPLSGKYNSYSNLANLLKFVRQHATNKHFKFAFHQTWAYAQNSTHPNFGNYNKNQSVMYDSIVSTVKRVVKQFKIKGLIPAGTTIQNIRTIIGDKLCRDGYHLSLSIGRYAAACTWCEYITHRSVVGNTYHPSSISSDEARIAQEMAHAATKRPYQISNR